METKTIEKPRQIWWKIRPHIDYGTIEFRICDAQRSIRKLEMLTALSQALVHQAVIDYNNDSLLESFNMEYLYDALWKASRFPLSANMIDPETSNVSSLSDQIHKMIEYANDSLIYFNNSHINQEVDKICQEGTEGDNQIKVYNKSGFEDLRKYLMDNIEFQLK